MPEPHEEDLLGDAPVEDGRWTVEAYDPELDAADFEHHEPPADDPEGDVRDENA